jgi:branched-chain amino acid transport system substrate-binding protein
MKHWKALFAIIGVVAVAVVGWLIYRANVPPREEVIKIGAILPLTGPAADIGTQAKRGLEIAAKQLGVTIIYEDSQGDAKQAISAFRKLVATHGARLTGVISMLSGVGNAIIPIAEAEKIVTIHIASAPGMCVGKRYAFRWYITSEAQMTALVQYLQAQHVTLEDRIAFLYTNDEYGKGAAEAFERAFRKIYGHAPTILKETYEKDQTDFRNIVVKVNSFGPDVVAVVGYSKSLGILVQQIRQQSVRARLFVGDDAISYPEILRVAGSAADGFVFPGLLLAPPSQDDRAKAFFQEYEREFRQSPGDFAIFAFGIANMLSSCAPSGRSVRSEMVKQCLETRVHQTPLGPVSFDPETHEGQVPLVYKEIKNGQVKVIDHGR